MSTIGRIIVVILILVVIIVGAAWLLNRGDNRTAGEKVGDAIDAVPDVISSAAADYSQSSPLAKAEDAIEKAGNTAESAISRLGSEAKEAASETSADIKAVTTKQKQQDRAEKRAQE